MTTIAETVPIGVATPASKRYLKLPPNCRGLASRHEIGFHAWGPWGCCAFEFTFWMTVATL
jgi:hypothetical protein